MLHLNVQSHCQGLLYSLVTFCIDSNPAVSVRSNLGHNLIESTPLSICCECSKAKQTLAILLDVFEVFLHTFITMGLALFYFFIYLVCTYRPVQLKVIKPGKACYHFNFPRVEVNV